VRTESVATLQCSAENFAISAEVEAFEGDDSIHRKAWRKTIARELM